MKREPIVRLGERSLTIDQLVAVAERVASVGVSDEVRARLERCHEFAKRLSRSEVPVYGLTTGCGPLASNSIEIEHREEFQRNLVRSHATTLGTPHPTVLVRAAMTARAHVLAQGRSGVTPALIDQLAGMLNAGIHPIVREVGSVGASGDLVELAQIALGVLGEGSVEVDGHVAPAAEALRSAGLRPVQPSHREGLALMNGTSFHTGAAALLSARARRLVAAAEAAAAMVFEALRGNLESLSAELHAVRPHPGQRAVAERVSKLLAGSSLARGDDRSTASRQDAYTLRCIAQVLGAVVDTLEHAARVVQIEIDSVTDNPLFLFEEDRVVHGGNFHGQPVAMAIDQLKLAIVEIGVMCERRIARVLDPSLNDGLPPFLVRDQAGFHSGFMGLQYCASSMAADNGVLASPASVRSVPTNANNQDIVGMGMVAARQAARVVENVERMVAIELLCGAQALEIRGIELAAAGTRAAHAVVRRHAAPLLQDRPLGAEVERVCEVVRSGGFVSS